MNEFASQIEFKAAGRGMVAIWLIHKTAADEQVGLLAWPQQGRLIGAPPVDVEVARRLNAAAKRLNEELTRVG